MMNREEAIQDFMERYVIDRWQDEILAIDERYAKNKASIEKELTDAFVKVCHQAQLLQQQQRKGSIHYIYFSFLRTSILENKSIYRIDFYDENWFLDNEECCGHWDVDFIYHSLFQHMRELEEKRKAYARKVTAMDIEHFKLFEAFKYNMLVIEFIREQLPALLEQEAFKGVKCSEELHILAGEYMDQSEILYAGGEVKV